MNSRNWEKRAEVKLRVLIAGGGTGGHVYPGLAVYRALAGRIGGVEVLFAGARNGVEKAIFTAAEVPYVLLPGRGLRGGGFVRKVTAAFGFIGALLEAVRIVKRFDPDVVLGTGGYASAAVVTAAVLCRKPRVIQEQNSVPGLANRILSRFSHIVLLAYEDSRRYIPRRVVCAVVGNALRFRPGGEGAPSIASRLGLREDVPIVLIVGGSRGARNLNENAIDAARLILRKRLVQFVVLAGEKNYDDAAGKAADERDMVRVLPFYERMDLLYELADVAVARAGASSVFELAAFGVPTIFVPYPYAADDHQRKNVIELEEAGAAIVLEDGSLSPESLAQSITALLDDEPRRREMAERMKQWVKLDGADRSAEIIAALVKKNTMIETVNSNNSSNGRAAHDAPAPAACTEGMIA